MKLLLTGLRSDMPVGFMAGLGLIRVAPRHARLAWDPQSHAAVLHGMSKDGLLQHLVEHMEGRHRSPELHLVDEVRGLAPERYREMVANESNETLGWVRALWREDGEEIVPTNLCFTSGQQRMVLMARELALWLDPSGSDKARTGVLGKFEEALFGPWLYGDATASWGWDPASYRIGAQTPQAPAKMSTEGVAAAYWLAWEALPFLPCLPGRGTLGFVKENRVTKWTWASWAEPLPRDAVEAIVRRPSEAIALGGNAFEAEVVKSGYYQFFRPGRVRRT
jgi:hypothetical protein